jgi:hypothetical protein
MKKQKKENKLFKFIKSNALEIILILGLFCIVLASAIINQILGLYVLGIVLVATSLYVARR